MEENRETKYEVVRCEYFSGVGEPAITFKRGRVKFSAACLKKIPEDNYVLFLIDSAGEKLTIEPCGSDERDAIRWSSFYSEKRKPKVITGSEFCRRLFELMRWHDDCRYKLFGKAACGADGKVILAFDLNSAIIYRPDDSGKLSRDPDYPHEWGDSFGDPVEQRISNPLVRRITGNTELAAIHEISENGDEERENEQQL